MKVYTLKETAKILKIHYTTMWKWVKDGKIKAVQPSGRKGRWFITVQELEKFIKNG